jgi:3-isopropylmalate dehydrogenase
MLLDWLARKHGGDAFTQAATLIEDAVGALLADPARRTADLGGTLGTRAFAEALCKEVAKRKAE